MCLYAYITRELPGDFCEQFEGRIIVLYSAVSQALPVALNVFFESYGYGD